MKVLTLRWFLQKHPENAERELTRVTPIITNCAETVGTVAPLPTTNESNHVPMDEEVGYRIP